MSRNLLSAALFGALSFASFTSHAVVIDSFNGTGPYNLNAPQVATSVGNSSSGYARTLTSSTSGTDTNVQIDTGTNPGVYAHSQSSGVTGVSRIDFALGDVDLTDGGLSNAFRISLASADLSGIIGIAVNGGAFQTLTTNDILLASGLAFPAYADFLFSSFGAVDFEHISSVSLKIDGSGQEALDASIDNIGTVCSTLTANGGSGRNPTTGNCAPPPPGLPEPATLLLMGAGLAGFGFRRKAAV